MRIEFLCKNYTASEKLKDVITKKVDKLDKFFEDDTKVKIVLKKAGEVETLELTISLGKNAVMRAEVNGETMYNNIDLAIPKLEKQIIRYHSKMKSKKYKVRDVIDFMPSEAEKVEEKKVVRNKSFNLVPMTVEDAIEEMELVGHDFYVFDNKVTGNVTVLYTRSDGNYGLIEAIK